MVFSTRCRPVDQQTADEAKDTGTQRACGNDPFTARMDAMLTGARRNRNSGGQHTRQKKPVAIGTKRFHRRS